MRVLHIITGLRTAGAEMMLYKLISARHRADHLAVVALAERGPLAERIESCGVPVHALDMGPNLSIFTALLRIRRLIQQLQPDLIQGWMYHANLLASLVNSTISGAVPVLWNIRAIPDNLSDEKWLTRMMLRVGASASSMPEKILYNSYYSADQHQKLGFHAGRSIIIPNGFDCQIFRPDPLARSTLRAELGLSESVWLIGNVARYHPMKDHASFIKAAVRLIEQGGDAHFVMVGNGVERSNRELNGLISETGLNDRFHLLGERRDLPAIMNAIDIYTSSSYATEAFPNVVGEAMACETPCVVTDVGDSARLVSEYGAVVPPSDPVAITDQWLAWINEGREALNLRGRAARQRIKQTFDLPKIIDAYETLYQSLIRRP